MNNNVRLKNQILYLWKKGNKERTIIVQGQSMKPLIQDGNYITFRPLKNGEKVKFGDIAVFTSKSGLIAHRIVDRISIDDKVWFREKGDNNFYPSVIREDAVLGKVVKIKKKNFSINLAKWHWFFINRIFGYYWKVLFGILELFIKNKNNIFYTQQMKVPSVKRKKLLQFIIGLPVKFFRSRYF